eukprot:1161340-Pelagomonas_calceolata.AAC.13
MELANTCCDAPVIQDISKAAERAGKSTNHALSKLAMGCRQEADVVASVQALSPLALALLPINSVVSPVNVHCCRQSIRLLSNITVMSLLCCTAISVCKNATATWFNETDFGYKAEKF